VRRGVSLLADTVAVTLGPRGRNVVLERRHGAHVLTNDGVTIALEIELADPFENLGVRLVRDAAKRTGELVGDGTTTTIVLARELIESGFAAVARGVAPQSLKRGIDKAVARVRDDLTAQARPVSDASDRAAVAAMASGGDAALGELVAEAFARAGTAGSVTVDEGRGATSALHVVAGATFERGYLSSYFVTDPEEMRAVLDRPLVLVSSERLSDSEDVSGALAHAADRGRPLLVIAEDVEAEALATLVVNQLRGTARSCALRAPGSGELRREWLEDLATLTGGAVVGPERGTSARALDVATLGGCRRAIVTGSTTTLLEGDGSAAARDARVSALETELAGADARFDADRLRARLGRFTGGIARVEVGGATEVELRHRRARAEDAVAALRAAVAEGIVPGGGTALVRALARLEGDESDAGLANGRRVVGRALLEPCRRIALNAGAEAETIVEEVRGASGGIGYDAELGRMVDLYRAGVVDPALVVRTALANAASVAGLLLTTDALVVDDDAPPDSTLP
jgi:chaperonin GroEL